MRVEKGAFVVVLLVAAVVLAVPFLRGFAYSQIRQSLPGSGAKAGADVVKPSIPSFHPISDAQLVKEHPRDFLLRLALAEDHKNDPIGSIDDVAVKSATDSLLHIYPRRGVVYIVAARLPEYSDVKIPQRKEEYGVTPEESDKLWDHPKPPTREQLDGVRRCVALMDWAIAADPNNGWFHYVKAGYLYGLHRDKEAMAEVHLAAIAPRFTDYTDMRIRASNHLADLRGGFDPVSRANKSAFIGYAMLSQMRATARVAANLACLDIRHGNKDQGIREALDIAAIGDKMTRDASTFMQAMVGHAILDLGAGALNTDLDFKNMSMEAQRAAELSAYERMLTAHGYSKEAADLARQWRRCDAASSVMRRSCNAGEINFQMLLYYVVAFTASATVLPAVIILVIGWGIASLFTAKGGAGTLWDRRAGVTTWFLACLVIAPIIALLVKTPSYEGELVAALIGGESPSPIGPSIVLGIAAAVVLVSLLVGLALMLMRRPKDDENRRMPAVPLLIAYLSLVSGLAYLIFAATSFAGSETFLGSVARNMRPALIVLPVVAILAYALLRALQFRFGRVRRKAPFVFAATARYAMATASGLLALFYLCLILMTAFLGVRADAYARKSALHEAAVIRSICK